MTDPADPDPSEPGEGSSIEPASTDQPKPPPPSLWESVRILLLYGVCIGGLFGIRYIPAVENGVISPYTTFVAASAEFIIDVFGSEVSRDGLTLSGPTFSLIIMEECNGIAALLIFLAAVLAHPVSLKSKALGIALGVPAIYAFNMVRVVSLFYFRWHWPKVFDVMHLYVWQALVIFFAIITWLYWAGLCGPKNKSSAQAHRA